MQLQQIKSDVVKVLHGLGSQHYVHLRLDFINRDGAGGHCVLAVEDRPDHDLLRVTLDTDIQTVLDGYVLAYRNELDRAGIKVCTDDEWQERHPPPKLSYQVKLDQDFCADEKGNVLLAHGEEFYLNAWIRLSGNVRLEISYRHDNYPSLIVQTVCITDEELWKHLVKSFGTSWFVQKLNLGNRTLEELVDAWKTAE